MYGQQTGYNGGNANKGFVCHPRTAIGSLLAFLGFVLAAVGEFLLGAEFQKTSSNSDDLATYGLLVAIGVFIGGVGYFITSSTLCEPKRDNRYFGDLLVLVGVLSAAAFLFCSGRVFDTAASQAAQDEIQSYHYLAGVSFILVSLGWFVGYGSEISCQQGSFNPKALGHAFVVLFSLTMGIFYLVFAYEYTATGDYDTLGTMRILSGVSDCFIAIGLFLAVGDCC